MHTLTKQIALLCAFCFIFLLPTHASAQPIYTTPIEELPTIVQGDEISIDKKKTCTIGYIDHKSRIAYTADHCSFKGKKSVVYDNDDHIIGTIESRTDRSSKTLLSQSMGNDFNVIKLNNYVSLAENVYSGDEKVDISDVESSDRVCVYSRMQKKVNCGKIRMVAGNVIVGDSDAYGKLGDSGGPVWIPGKGFIGIYIGVFGNNYSNFYTTIDNEKKYSSDNKYKSFMISRAENLLISTRATGPQWKGFSTDSYTLAKTCFSVLSFIPHPYSVQVFFVENAIEKLAHKMSML